VGRGWSGRPSDDGGEGRGPANEACVMQIHPKMGGNEKLLGLDDESVARCFTRALEMIDDSERHCGRSFERIVSYYATGTYCNVKSRKVTIRSNLATKLHWKLGSMAR
jgi:hypothetical protein